MMKNYAKLIDGRLEMAPSEMVEDGRRYLPPTDEMLRARGWKEVVYPEPEEPVTGPAETGPMIPVYTEDAEHIFVAYVPAEAMPETRPYEQRVEALIREQYSVSDELAILRQRDTKPEEFAVYFDFCEACKVAERPTSNINILMER